MQSDGDRNLNTPSSTDEAGNVQNNICTGLWGMIKTERHLTMRTGTEQTYDDV